MLAKFLIVAVLAQPIFAVPAPPPPNDSCDDGPPDPPGPSVPPHGPGGPGGPGNPGGPDGPDHPGGPGSPKPWGFFTNNTIYQPVGSEVSTYPRYAELEDSTILATTSLIGHTPGYFP